MQFEAVQDPELEFNECLRMELGWSDVANGLTQVLMGYAVLFFGVVAGVGLIVLSLFHGFSEEAIKKGAKPSNEALWQLYLGLGILSVIGLISYCIIIGGQFKCLMHAAERHGARWFMFLCIACLFLGPAFQTASGIASRQAIAELQKNHGKIQDLKLNPLGQWLQLIAFGISMLYPLCFTLFLRAIAVCLRSPKHALVIDIFLAFGAILVAGTGFMLLQHPLGAAQMPPEVVLLLGLGWLVLGVLYVALIAATRVLIGVVTSRVRSPLAI